ncbi:MAG: 30S ribosomal protein S6 [Actinobacteria bacterium]|nr:30S ribosomal protein S6 [Actinomycetota bacterium]
MKAYELMLLLNPALEEEARAALLEKVEGLVSANGAVDSIDSWGKRRLAFEIQKLTEGDYVVVNFRAEPSAIAEIDRVLHITDPVVRYMLVRREDKDQLPAGAPLEQQ